jgi:hypothetical protein
LRQVLRTVWEGLLLTDKTEQKPTLPVLPENSRKRLFDVLSSIISFSEEKIALKGNSDKAKQSWSRICISAVKAYGGLLESADNGEINRRLDALEEKAKRDQKTKMNENSMVVEVVDNSRQP